MACSTASSFGQLWVSAKRGCCSQSECSLMTQACTAKLISQDKQPFSTQGLQLQHASMTRFDYTGRHKFWHMQALLEDACAAQAWLPDPLDHIGHGCVYMSDCTCLMPFLQGFMGACRRWSCLRAMCKDIDTDSMLS